MGDVNSLKVRTPQGSGLDSCRAHELVGGHGDCRDSQILQPDRIVQTARGAGPSIGQTFDYGVGVAELFDHRVRSVLGVGGLARSYDFGDLVAFPKYFFQAVEKEATARLAYVQQANLL